MLCMLASVFLPVDAFSQSAIPEPGNTVTSFEKVTLLCGNDAALQMMRKDPVFVKGEEKMNAEVLRYSRGTNTNSDVTVLPVVFHIINNNPFAIADQQMKDGLQELNDAFSKSGLFAGSAGVDTKIRFCLAKTDPDGGVTTGITRTTSFFSNDVNVLIEDSKLKNLIQWDPKRYINIWYVTNLHYEIYFQFSCGTFSRLNAGGYATLPPNAGPADGIVVTSFGKLLVHEMGHYLGLYHTFEGGCYNADCKLNGDRICDTPPDGSIRNSFSCNSPENSCTSDTFSGFTIDVPDQVANFMDYGNDNCHNQFTQGQADRMVAVINTQRSGLLQNECEAPCPVNAVASFTRDNADPIAGSIINFTNTSTGATLYEWLVDDVVKATSANFTFTFTGVAKTKVSLKAYNSATCFSAYTSFVITNCGVTARFYTNKRTIASKGPNQLDTIIFTNTSVNGVTYQWIMSSNAGMAQQVISTAENFSYAFDTPGNYLVYLIATNGSCSDTTGVFTIPVLDPTADAVAFVLGVDCYQQTKIRLNFFVCNYGFTTIPKNTPISFYDKDPRQNGATKFGTFYLPADIPGNCCGYLLTTIIDAKTPRINKFYISVNDSGSIVPLAFPNTLLEEKNYDNNVRLIQNFAFKTIATPSQAIMEPGDTLAISAIAGPSAVASNIWSPAANFSCINCNVTRYIADTNAVITKQLISTSQYACTDTAYVTIKVPPYNDYSLSLTNVECAGSDSIYVNFDITNNFKRGILPRGLQVAFYSGNPAGGLATLLPPVYNLKDTIAAQTFSFAQNIEGAPAGIIYAVVNDSGKVVPLILPNTNLSEKLYNNNFAQYNYVRVKATATPAASTMEPGDTLQLTSSAQPGTIASFQWINAANLTCTSCPSPQFITPFPFGDSTIIKKLVVTNNYGCTDTAQVQIRIPPYNDYVLEIKDIQCSRGDSIRILFSIGNNFKRGNLPKGLTLAFYSGDPLLGNATFLAPLFILTNSIAAKVDSFIFIVKGINNGKVVAVVNDNATVLPVTLPVTNLPEKSVINNFSTFNYIPETVIILPVDTTVFRKQPVLYSIANNIYNAASTRWLSLYNSLNCATCVNPVATPLQSDTIKVTTENSYGCPINGSAVIKIFPPNLTVKILNATCYTNNVAQVIFTVCTNNGYDSMPAGIPISFYSGSTVLERSILLPVYRTPAVVDSGCRTYTARISLPRSNHLTAIINDKGNQPNITPIQPFDETNYTDNSFYFAFTAFKIDVIPGDTTINRLGNVLMQGVSAGGTINNPRWSPTPNLSCTLCNTTVATPPFTTTYLLTAKNEFGCTDTATAIVRTITGKGVFVPSAFTPNNDRLNDVLYVMAGPEVKIIKTFAIFNRWGQKIFIAQNVPPNLPTGGWNGKVAGTEAMTGTYLYYVTVLAADGKEETLKGTVVLIR